MDYHALQQKLFALDPTDPREDLAKLQQAAQGGGMTNVAPTKDYVTESVEVPQGSMPLGIDSVADFAALAGIVLKEAPQTAPAPQQMLQKAGMGAKMVGNKLGAKGSAGMMGKALDKVAQGGALPANLAQQIAPFAKSLETILADPQLRNKFMTLIKQAEAAGKKAAAPAQTLSTGQSPGTESIKERLYAELAKHKLKK
jgi:hypothetical protein